MKLKRYRSKKEFTMKQKIKGTVLCLLLYRMLSFVPLPFVDSAYIKAVIDMNGSLGLLNMLSGGSLGNMSLMALGIAPWITASIVLQLLGLAFPVIADMNKDESGRKKYKRITFGISVVMAMAESVSMMVGYGKQGYLSNYSWYTVLVPSLMLIAGTGILSLMSWYIDEKLFGNGTSLILTAGILCSYVSDGTLVGFVVSYGKSVGIGIALCVVLLIALFGLFAYTVFISSCEKRIRVTYSRKLPGAGIGRSVGAVPLKLIAGGVLPVIFASTITTIPALIGSVSGLNAGWLKIFNTSYWMNGAYPWASVGFVIYLVLIVAFSYFCRAMYVNPVQIAESLQKAGGTIPGIRPGLSTVDYIASQTKWLTGLGGIMLCVVASLPVIVSGTMGLSNLSFLGTSILITVSTISDTWKEWMTWRRTQCYASGDMKKGIF